MFFKMFFYCQWELGRGGGHKSDFDMGPYFKWVKSKKMDQNVSYLQKIQWGSVAITGTLIQISSSFSLSVSCKKHGFPI